MLSKHVKGLIFTFVILFLLVPIQAHAGWAKIFSVYEAIMPPAILWVLFVVGWYLAVATAATRHGHAIGGIPPLPKAFGILLIVAFLGLTVVGPLAVIYLLFFFPKVTFTSFFPSSKSRIKGPTTVMLRRISIVSVLVLAGLITTSIYIHSQRSKSEFQRLLHASNLMEYHFVKALSYQQPYPFPKITQAKGHKMGNTTIKTTKITKVNGIPTFM
jgi:hypothetical protein